MEWHTYPLWEGVAPDTDLCGDQGQPAITSFPVQGARGAVVVCPGGGYRVRADHEGNPVCFMLQNAGIAAFLLDYRVYPCGRNTPLSDAKRAIRYVRSLGYEKVGILGFSAGGHLCCTAATQFDDGNPDADDPIERYSSRPDAFVPCYPVVSFLEYPHQGTVESLLGAEKTDEALLRHYSAELHVNSHTPPAFIWHTSTDQGVPVQNSLMLARALADHGVLFEMHIYPQGPHGVGLGEELSVVSPWAEDCARFLTGLGFGR